MVEHIQQYYLSERSAVVAAGIASLFFLLAAFLLWRLAEPTSLGRGMAYVLFPTGLFFASVGIGGYIYNTRKLAQTEQSGPYDEGALQQSEIQRMDKVMATSYIPGIGMFLLCMAVGLILVFATRQPLYKGVALGLLLLGTLGLTVEGFSIRRNAAYRETIKQYIPQ